MSKTPTQKASPQAAKPAPPHPIDKKAPQLRLERVFNATPDKLWSYWVDPKKYARWLSPEKANLVIHEFDVRVGGRVRFDMPLDNGQVNKEEGVFHVLDKPKKLVSGSPDKSFLITAYFEPVDDKHTRLRIVVDGVPAEYHGMATVGWGKGLDKLAGLLTLGKGNGASRTHGAHHPPSPRAVGKFTDGMVHVERWFKAPPEKVFAAWSSREMLPKFFWPVGTGKVETLDFKVGGKLVMSHATEDWTATWTYVEIVPGKKIVTRDQLPGTDVVATGTLEFTPTMGGTLLKVTYGPFPKTGPYAGGGAAAGFSMALDRLAEETEVLGDGDGFQLIRYFKAKPAKVWEMWTTKAGLDKWWKLAAKDMGYAFKVNQLDVRVGGNYDLQMSNQEHGELHNHGVYTEVTPHTRLAQRWDFDIFLGPGEKPYPIAITIDFMQLPPEAGGGTMMTFTQGPMAKAEFTEGSRQGVISNFAKLAKALGE